MCAASTAYWSVTPPRPFKRRYHTKVTRQPRLWRCNMCDSTFIIKYSLQKHSEKHGAQEQVSHQICGFRGCAFSCLAWVEIRRHKKEEHSGKKGFF